MKQEATHVFGYKRLRLQPNDCFNHRAIQAAFYSCYTFTQAVDREILAWESTDYHIRPFRHCVQRFPYVATMDVVCEVLLIAAASYRVEIVCPFDIEWKPPVLSTKCVKTTLESEV